MSQTKVDLQSDFGDDKHDAVDPEIVLQQLLDNPSMVQHLVRSIHDGAETVVAYYRVTFEPEQQQHVVHVPLQPAFRVVPQVTADAIDHQTVRVRVTDQQKFGARIELTLPQIATTKQQLLVEIVATESPMDSSC